MRELLDGGDPPPHFRQIFYRHFVLILARAFSREMAPRNLNRHFVMIAAQVFFVKFF